MRRSSLFVGILMCLTPVFAQQQNSGNKSKNQEAAKKQEAVKTESDIIRTGDRMPLFKINSSNPAPSMEELKGKVVLINLFATWCGPCQTELAEIQETLWPRFKDDKKFKMLTIGREHDDQELEKYQERKKFSFPLYPDKDRSIYNKFAKSYIPRTYLIGKNGKVIFTSVGFNKEEYAKLLDLIQQELKK